MLKKTFLIIICLFFAGQMGFSKEIPVKIKPVMKITTSDLNLKEGDITEFVIVDDICVNSKTYLKKGEMVFGTITSLEDNDFGGKTASVYIEDFYYKNSDNKKVKLNGIIYKKGNAHPVIVDFIADLIFIVRGGEVQITPEKDEFIIYSEVI